MKIKLISFLFLFIPPITIIAQPPKKAVINKFTESLMLDSCTFETKGRNPYFILEPGYQQTLDGIEDRDSVHLVITVLNEIKKIGNIETRVVEERESVNGKMKEVSRNYFAFCKQTSSIFYFGEDVDMYKDGKVENHEGSWLAEGNNRAGLAMPGTILIGSRYYQEVAQGIAMDRAEIISVNETLKTEAGNFTNCVKTEETTPLEPKSIEYKMYARGVGLVQDGELSLTKYGFLK